MSNTQDTPKNPLLNPISASTKSRVLDAIFPNPTVWYADEISYNLTRVKRVLSGLSKLRPQNEENEGDDQITGELAMALSELLEQQVDIAIVLLQGSVFDGERDETTTRENDENGSA